MAKEEGKKAVSTLDIAKKAIIKKYGDVVKPMSDKPLVINTISTRSLGLDAALGRGGFALGRIYEIYGAPSSGKCLTADTFVSSQYGLLTIKELFEVSGEQIFTTNKIKEKSCILRNENGLQESTSCFTWNNKKPVFHICTDAGFEIKVTANHKIRVIDPNTGFVIWKKASTITTDDYVMLNTTPSDIPYTSKLTSEEATFLGMLIAEGAMGYDNKFCFTNSNIKMLNLFEALCASLFNFKNCKYYSKDSNTFSYVVHSKELRTLLQEKYNIPIVLSAKKEIPICIRAASTTAVASFLSAYFSLDGCYEGKSNITAVSASKALVKQIQLLLLDRFGIKSYLTTRYNVKYDREYYQINITGSDATLFLDKIGFILDDKLKKLETLGVNYTNNTLKWNIPYQNTLLLALRSDVESSREFTSIIDHVVTRGDLLSFNKLNLILDYISKVKKGFTAELIFKHLQGLQNMACTKVLTNTLRDAEPTFDVVMPETHSFIANGFLNHNTTLAMSIIAEAQSRNMSCAFVDAEHSADPKLFESMGVDLTKLSVIDLFTGEDNLMVAETIMKTGALDLLVIDSVTSLIPKVAADANLDDSTIALLARLMSKTLLRFVPIAAETNTCIIFINQTRNKIGGYGNPETTTGGEALPFYATGRVRVSGIGAKANRLVDDKGKVVGHKTIFEIIKNKLAAPFTSAEADLIYGVGYDNIGEIIKIATDLGVLTKGGSWYSYEGNNIGQGENGVRKFFNENPDVFLVIKQDVTDILGLTKFYEAQKNYDNSKNLEANE